MLVNMHDQVESFVHEDFLSKINPENHIVLHPIKLRASTPVQKIKFRSKFHNISRQKFRSSCFSKILFNFKNASLFHEKYEWGPHCLATPPPSKFV